jgi:hypothetical protein
METLKAILLKINLVRLGAAFTVMFVLILVTYALLHYAIPEANKESVIHLLGIIEGGFLTIVGYEFGNAREKIEKPA